MSDELVVEFCFINLLVFSFYLFWKLYLMILLMVAIVCGCDGSITSLETTMYLRVLVDGEFRQKLVEKDQRCRS